MYRRNNQIAKPFHHNDVSHPKGHGLGRGLHKLEYQNQNQPRDLNWTNEYTRNKTSRVGKYSFGSMIIRIVGRRCFPARIISKTKSSTLQHLQQQRTVTVYSQGLFVSLDF